MLRDVEEEEGGAAAEEEDGLLRDVEEDEEGGAAPEEEDGLLPQEEQIAGEDEEQPVAAVAAPPDDERPRQAHLNPLLIGLGVGWFLTFSAFLFVSIYTAQPFVGSIGLSFRERIERPGLSRLRLGVPQPLSPSSPIDSPQ